MATRGQRVDGLRAPQKAPRSRRALALTLLALAAAAAALLAWYWTGERAGAATTAEAQALFRRGAPADLRAADRVLADALASGPDTRCLHAAQDLVRAHLWVEYGLLPEEAITEDAEDDRDRCPDAVVTDALLSFGSGDIDGAERALAAAVRRPDAPSLAPTLDRWLAARIALTRGDDLAAALAALAEARAADPAALALARLLAELQLHRGDPDAALATLRDARQRGPDHLGLAADEALFLAAARRELRSVADLADQLLAIDPVWTGPFDRGRALVARAVVDVHGGEAEAGLARLDGAVPLLAPWDRLARRLAIDLALEAGDAARARAWLPDAHLPAADASAYEAWALLVEGRPMAALAALAALPQDAPRVAYLQALALVEQQRLDEAGPWVSRAERFYPGNVELEVAAARVAVHSGDRVAALRRLKGLAEEESFAPRAWTGLGEALVAQGGPQDLRDAHRALTRAIEREPRPAEAMLRLAEIWQHWRRSDPESERRALEWLQRAAETCPELPRYRLALALHLADTGQHRRAEAILLDLVDAPGVDARPALALARLALDRADQDDAPLPAALDAWLASARDLGAPGDALDRIAARRALLTGERRRLVAARDAMAARVDALPDDVEARDLYARVLVALRDDEEAEVVIRRGLRSDEDGDGRLFLTLADLELRTGKRKQAAIHARAAWNRLRESERPTVELLAAADLATRLFSRADDFSQAQAIARDLTRRLPIHGDAWRIAARTHLAAGDAAEAKRAAEQAIARAPDDPRAHALHGQILLRYGSRAKAKAAYERALALAAGTPDEAKYRDALRRL